MEKLFAFQQENGHHTKIIVTSHSNVLKSSLSEIFLCEILNK